LEAIVQGKHVILTGGTGGLGMGVTPKVMAQQPASVTIPYNSAKNVERLKSILSPSDFSRIQFVQTDLSSEEEVKNLVDKATGVDVLIHLVGGFAMGKIHEYSFQDWKKDFDLNLHTTFLMCKYCLGKMLESGYGRIVTVGSRGAVQPAGQLGSYCASKAAVVALTQSIADETKGTNITANAVLPSVIDTPTNREAMGSENASQWVRPESVGEAICFLASEAAAETSGATLPVYGQV
jgi:NAD(P)-dependent dehydrogenase (short-subunit alcohol dehydrogenase family)